MPLQLGVPKAILDNVIFCHQEESFWPLSEPSTLKKKFDEIFASTKYTKALDSIKSFRKEQVIALKLAQNNVSHLKEKRGKARRVAESLTLVEGKLETAQSRIEALDSGEIETTVQEMTDLMEQNRRVQEARFKVQQAESERGIIEKSIGELKAGLQEYAGMYFPDEPERSEGRGGLWPRRFFESERSEGEEGFGPDIFPEEKWMGAK
ncbi:hypothetical protein DFS34DRAFT_592510 [Phlyctochytrium arcticum]|nr:hypothetical protein DFS34DRAFT_592510 [Phlyctochytrium arcticum]